MYFNCTNVNRETILSECLEEMEAGGKRSQVEEALASPNFGEEGREATRPRGKGRYQCKCACRDCRLANLAEAQKYKHAAAQKAPNDAKQ